MTPQERQLVAELFDRLASLEKAPRDPEAMQAIEQGLQRAPNAIYALVQSVLVQDEALKSADAHIRELESELGIAPAQSEQGTSFLSNMRDDMPGRREPSQGSVPSVRPGAAAPISNAWRTTRVAPGDYGPQGDYPPQGNYPAQGPGPSGGSFLGTAAATAAGAIGGALLMNSLRGMMGGNQAKAGALDPGSSPATPWGENASGSDLARQAGVNDIGGGAGTAANSDGGGSRRAGLFDSSANDSAQSDDDDVGYEDGDDDSDIGGDSDDA